ncbi:hypothetical protein OQA88_4559 [Cercophora sp. LCS_1]
MASLADREIDSGVLEALPGIAGVLSVKFHGESAWAKAIRIDVRHKDDSKESYFMKVSYGQHGQEALKGEFEATSTIYSITPDFCPKPIAWGALNEEADAHFYVCKFYDFTEGVPEPVSFCEKLARLHSAYQSPEGKFGFHCTTYNGNLPQDNTWNDSWEAFFDNGLRHVLKVREERAPPSDELNALLPALFDKVIPRLLRPLESHGRKIQPSLVHGDLWCGNASIIDQSTEEGIVYDPSSFWAHNEYELGNWRPARNKFNETYFKTYHTHIPKSEPEEDYDDRNALYALRFNLHAATLFPSQGQFLKMAIDEIRRLTEKFKDGHANEEIAPMDADHRHVCKFDTPSNSNYRTLRDALLTAVDESKASLSMISAPRSFAAGGGAIPGLDRYEVLSLGPSDVSRYFICKHSKSGESTLSDCLRSLAFQMAQQDVLVREALLGLALDDRLVWDKTDDSSVWRRLFAGCIFKLKPAILHQHVWVVDGIDECVHFNNLFTKRLLATLPLELRFFATSRQFDEIERGIVALGPQKANFHVMSEADTHEDMRLFTITRLTNLRRPEDPEDRNFLCEQILQKSSGTFLWTRLVLQEFENTYIKEDMDRVLNETPTGLFELYSRMARSIEDDDRKLTLAKSILTWVILASRPLTVEELRCAVKFEIGQTIQNGVKVIPDLCGQLVTVDQGDKVQVIHETVREFLLHSEDSELVKLKVDEKTAHTKLGAVLLQYLSGNILKPSRQIKGQRDAGGRTRGFQKNTPVIEAAAPDASLLDYACKSLSEHLYRATSADDGLMANLCAFLKTSSVLSWIEHIAKNGDLATMTQTAINLREYYGRRLKYVPPPDSSMRMLDSWITDLIRVAAKNLISADQDTISWKDMDPGEEDCFSDMLGQDVIPTQPPSKAAFMIHGDAVLLAVGYRGHPILVWNALESRLLGFCQTDFENNGIDDIAFNPNPEIPTLTVSCDESGDAKFPFSYRAHPALFRAGVKPSSPPWRAEISSIKWGFQLEELAVTDKAGCESVYSKYLGFVPTMPKVAVPSMTSISVFTTVTPGRTGAGTSTSTAGGTATKVSTSTSGTAALL